MAYRRVAIADNGRRVGESHPKAKLTDHDVDLIRELATQRDDHGRVTKQGLSYTILARKFEVGKSVIQKIVECSRRAVPAVRFKRVLAGEEEVQPAPLVPNTKTGSGSIGS